MPEFKQPEKPTQREMEELAEQDTERQAEIAKEGADLDEATEALLDEIDGLLESDAQDFVDQFRQRGGQ